MEGGREGGREGGKAVMGGREERSEVRCGRREGGRQRRKGDRE